MARFLSDEWIADLDRAASSSDALRVATGDFSLTVQQVVTEPADRSDTEATTWFVSIDHGAIAVRAGRATRPDVTFTQDRATATAVGRGELSAQAAFMLGRLRVGGEVSLLTAHQGAFAGLDDVFAEVRDRTTYAEENAHRQEPGPQPS
jgi:putative sterol carrier protein